MSNYNFKKMNHLSLYLLFVADQRLFNAAEILDNKIKYFFAKGLKPFNIFYNSI